MFNYVVREGRLLIQAKTGLNSGLLVWSVFGLIAILLMFAFLCVAFYFWLALQLGVVFGALAVAGAFLLLALIFVVCASASRSSTKKRAKLERAERVAATPARLFDPQLLKTGIQTGRAIGWQRIFALVLLGAVPQPFCAGGRGQKKVNFGKLITGPSRSELRSSALAG
jgi:hypothetical protein